MGYVYEPRQMPKNVSYTADKRYNDLIYGYLQTRSYRIDGKRDRCIPKIEATMQKIGNDLDMTRQTVAKYFNNLKDMGLVTKEGNLYLLAVLDTSDGVLIPQNTLITLVDKKESKMIDVYIYLLNRYRANNYQAYLVLFGQIESYINVSFTHGNEKISKILEELKDMGLIGYKKRRDESGNLHLEILYVKQYTKC